MAWLVLLIFPVICLLVVIGELRDFKKDTDKILYKDIDEIWKFKNRGY